MQLKYGITCILSKIGSDNYFETIFNLQICHLLWDEEVSKVNFTLFCLICVYCSLNNIFKQSYVVI
jgi:hypothetical protein